MKFQSVWMHGEKNDRGGGIKAPPPPMGLGLRIYPALVTMSASRFLLFSFPFSFLLPLFYNITSPSKSRGGIFVHTIPPLQKVGGIYTPIPPGFTPVPGELKKMLTLLLSVESSSVSILKKLSRSKKKKKMLTLLLSVESSYGSSVSIFFCSVYTATRVCLYLMATRYVHSIDMRIQPHLFEFPLILCAAARQKSITQSVEFCWTCKHVSHRTCTQNRRFHQFGALTLKRLGGGGFKAPPRHFTRLLCNAQSSRGDTLWLFSFEFPAHFDTKFLTLGGTVLKLRNFLYMHVGPKMAPKCDFVYKINANWVFFSRIVHINMLIFYSQWLKLICFSIIVLQKVSATNFAEKNNKNKRKTKQRNT